MILMKKNSFCQSGQVALIIILLMAVVGTVALSVVSRSVTDVSLSKQEENKIRAFSAAEAGIENLLNQGLANIPAADREKDVTGNINYHYKIDEVGNSSTYELDGQLLSGETTQVQLAGGTSAPSSLRICWTGDASLEISVFSFPGGNYQVTRTAVKAITGGASGIDFTPGDSVGSPCGSKTYLSETSVSLTQDAQFVRIKALYNNTDLAIQADVNLPVQAYKVKVDAVQEENTAALEVTQTIPAAPGIFDYTLWSGSSL